MHPSQENFMNTSGSIFCSNCGCSLHDGARFCGNCGAQVVASTVPAVQVAQPAGFPVPGSAPQAVQPQVPPVPSIQPDEPVLQAMASFNLRKGLFGRKPFLLLITPRRLVFAVITAEQQKWAAEQAKENARQQGKGFLKQWGAAVTSINFLADTYRAMPVPQTLSHHPDNFYIDLSQIERVKTKFNWDIDAPNTPDEVEIRYAGGKLKFELAGCGARDVKEALRPLLGSRVK
jgi:hypothetical protein